MSSQKSFTFSLGTGTPLDRVASLLSTVDAKPDYAYERQGPWHVGIGSLASLAMESDGRHATISTLGGSDLASFNFAPHIKGLSYHAGRWPLLTLMIPQTELNIHSGGFTILGDGVNQAYTQSVADGLSQLRGGRLAKVILSRAVDLVGPVNMPQTLLTGLKSNTPRTTFCLSHGGFQATGFSPELVMSLENGRVTTEPLAGTHSCGCSDAERLKCDKNFSHLGSRVCGQLNEAKDAWDAFDTHPRELYSGSVIMLEGSDFFEGALVLRLVYQDEEKAWVQAGAGIIDQSEPAREFIETVKKLSTIAPFVVPL
ncbi:isochorismate synthase/isochorismate-pyruvate lyase mbtI [Verticillium dahliae]|nr:isochorismate synthase/isochorismate-pyruvate lyase mbtI [Verticillium dahliae]